MTIANKTGSTRTSFALWGTLKIYNSDGSLKSSDPIFACAGPIPKSSITTLVSSKTVTFGCGESLKIVDLFLAWTSASPNETCDKLEANPSLIAPKCGTLPEIQVAAGVDANFNITDATCTSEGSVQVFPFGGDGLYSVTVDAGSYQAVGGTSITFTNLSAGPHTFKIKDSRNCEVTKNRSVGSPPSVTANAGSDFTKTCTTNPNGKQIGDASEAGFTYSWSPSTGLSASNISNPTANPSSTTTYTVTKTSTATGCSDTDDVDVTVNNAAVTANAGADFTKTCTTNPNGKQIGVASEAGFTYSWSPGTGLSATNISNPTANPDSSTTYTVTKTNTSTGCSDTDDVDVTVSNDIPETPTVCVVEPSLCGPSTGSITILSPTGAAGEYAYSIDNGSSYTVDKTFWDGLAAGSVTGIKVKNVDTGCESSAADCSDSDCSAPSARVSDVDEKLDIEEVIDFKETSIKAYPNPFNNTVSFRVDSSKDTEGSLELVNMLGQRVMTIYNGKINAGTRTFEVNLPSQQSTTLIYVLRLGEERITGKLIQLKR